MNMLPSWRTLLLICIAGYVFDLMYEQKNCAKSHSDLLRLIFFFLSVIRLKIFETVHNSYPGNCTKFSSKYCF